MKRTIYIVALAACLLAVVGATPGRMPGGGGFNYSPTLALPDTTFVAVGREFNVWYDAMSTAMPGMAATTWLCYSTSGTGDTTGTRALDRSWRWTPTAAKSEALTIRPVDGNGTIGATATMVVRAIDAAAGSGEHRVLFIGDSLLDGTSTDTTTSSSVISLVDSLVNVTDAGAGTLVTIGTQGTNFMGEGRSGYTTTRYVNSYDDNGHFYNPFWDADPGQVNFRDYLTRHSLTGPIDDYVIMLGWNDVAAWGGSYATDAQIAATIANLDTLVTVAKDGVRGFADARVMVCTCPVGANSLASFSLNYPITAANKDDWPFYQANIRKLNAAIIARYDHGGTYSDPRGQVDVVPVHLWVDRKYGYPYSTRVASARNPNTEFRHTGFIHPNYSGQDQEADAMYSRLRLNYNLPNPINLLSESELFGTWTATGSPTWVGWAACTVADVDSAAGQSWLFTGNAATYFTLATTGLTVQPSNTISCFFKRPTTGAGYDTYVRLYVDLTGGTDRYAGFLIRDANPNGYLTTFEHLYDGGVYGGANADSSRSWHRCAGTPSGWARISFSFSNLYDTTDQTGLAIAGIRIYINYQTTGRTGIPVDITGAQFEQGVRRPSVYVPKP